MHSPPSDSKNQAGCSAQLYRNYSYVAQDCIEWTKRVCSDNNYQYCGIGEIKWFSHKRYIGLALEEHPDNPPERYNFALYAFFDENDTKPSKVYRVIFSIAQDNEDNYCLFLTKHYLKSYAYERMGIGTDAMNVLKDIAFTYDCKKIVGIRKPINNTPDEQEKLWNFYDKNGFAQWENENYIEFDMADYKPE